MRILISGAAGFIGSHLADALLAGGHDVVGVDNLTTGRLDTISHLRDDKRFTFIQADVTEPLKLSGPIDQIYHLASPASPKAFETMRIATLKANSEGTWRLLDLALEKSARFLVASTSEIYGDPLQEPQREEYWGNVNPIGLRSMYEEAKRFAEACAMAYNRERGADTRIVRIFNAYGPRMDLNDGRVITSFVRQAMNGDSVTVFGDGTQTRSFCYISDTVAGIIGTMAADFHEPINLGNPNGLSVIQLAREIIAQVPGSRSKIIFAPSPAYDPRLRQPDISRAKQILNWKPKVSHQEGLALVVRYFTEK